MMEVLPLTVYAGVLVKALKGMASNPRFVAEVTRISKGGFDPNCPRDLKVVTVLANTVVIGMKEATARIKEN